MVHLSRIDRADFDQHARCDRCGRHYRRQPRADQKLWSMAVDRGAIMGFRCPRCQPAVASDEGAEGSAASAARPPAGHTPGFLMPAAVFRSVCERAVAIGGLAPTREVREASRDRDRVFVSAYVNPDGHHLGAAFVRDGAPDEFVGDGDARWPLVAAQGLIARAAGGSEPAVYLEVLSAQLARCRPALIDQAWFGPAIRERTREYVGRVIGLALPE